MTLTIQEIKTKWSELNVEGRKDLVLELKGDSRKGVQKLVNQFEVEINRDKERIKLFGEMSKYERELYASGHNTIGGIDEVGRGTLVDSVVSAAVILPKDCYLPELNDSKKLTEKKREDLYEEIKEKAISIGIGIVSAEEIDEINIYQATKKAMKLAVNNLDITPDYLLIDAMSLDIPIPQKGIVKGDSKSISIAASSIVAKVTRDRMMKKLGEKYPEYGFEQHMGYGTKQHLKAIYQHGVLPEHRKSFAPIKEMLRNQ